MSDQVGLKRGSGKVPERAQKLLVPMRFGVTPVPIPNTTVKTEAAENTTLETMWEDRWVPDSNGLIAQPVRAHA